MSSVESGNKFDRVFWITLAGGRDLKSSRTDKIDAYVKINFDCETFPEKAKTQVIESVNPDWNETFYFLMDSNGGGSHVKFELYDEDTGRDDHKGDALIPFPDLWETHEKNAELDTKGHLIVKWGYFPLNGVEALKKRVESLTAENGELTAENGELTARVAALEEDDVADEEEKTRLRAALDEAAASAAAQDAAAEELQAQLEAAQADDEADEAAIAALAAQLEGVQIERAAAAAKNEELAAEVAALTADKAAFEEEAARLKEALDANDAAAAELQAQLEAAQADDDADEAAVAALSAQIEALKAEKAAAAGVTYTGQINMPPYVRDKPLKIVVRGDKASIHFVWDKKANGARNVPHNAVGYNVELISESEIKLTHESSYYNRFENGAFFNKKGAKVGTFSWEKAEG